MSWNPPWLSDRLSDAELQDRLFRYFSTGVDEIDLFGPPSRIPVRELTSLKATNPELFADDHRPECGNFASWRVMSAVRKMPPGIWYRHGSKNAFRQFLYGTRYCGMQNSTNRAAKAQANCSLNLSRSLPDSERVWGFAYPAMMTDLGISLREKSGIWTPEFEQLHDFRVGMGMRRAGSYGDFAVYFKTNAAVEVWHIGDSEWQIVFPLCSEYDVFTSEDAAQFPGGAMGAMDYIDSGKGKFSGLSGLARGPRFAFRR